MPNRMIPTIGALLLTLAALAACASPGGPPPTVYVAPPPAYTTASVTIIVGPPELPVYVQPPCPGDGYIWTPGYWAWGGGEYYWVPGTWVQAPQVGYLWTPGYWGWGGGSFVFHEGYWGPRVGFYGGINYGYGYTGHGFEGGRWENDHFSYNRSVSNVDVTVIHNVYNTTVVNNNTTIVNNVTRVSYNGGSGGINARPTPEEETAAQGTRLPPVAAQTQHVQAARANMQLRASVNNGKPPIAATSRPGAFSEPGVVAASEAGTVHNVSAPPANNVARPPTAVHANELVPVAHPPAPATGNPNLDQQHQQEQEKLLAQQNLERLDLQKKQELDHQRLAQQNADAATTQKLELQHQQETQQLAQKHAQELDALKKGHQQPPHLDQANPPKDKQP